MWLYTCCHSLTAWLRKTIFFEDVLVDGVSVGAVTGYTFTNVT